MEWYARIHPEGVVGAQEALRWGEYLVGTRDITTTYQQFINTLLTR